jgi:GH3 auxin-responsive promoter
MPSVLSATLTLGAWARHARFQRAVERPERAQAAVLRALLAENAGTAFGRAHRFSRIGSPAEYARRVPIRDFEGFRPWVERILAGEPGVLTAETPTGFATTSGTTGQPKLIPITPSWETELAGLMRLWMFAALRDHPDCFDHAALTLVSPAVEDRSPDGRPVGALSGMAYQRIPWLVRRQYAVPYAGYLIRDPDTRYFVIMRLGLARAVSVIATPNATSLIRLAQTATRYSETIVRAIHDGTLGIPVPELEPAGSGPAAAELGAIQARLRPDPARARALARVVAAHGRLEPGACWPELRLIACWLGGTAGLHARRLADHYGDVPLRDLGLVASEGRMTVPLEDGTPAGVLAIDTNFYEFIPEERIDEPAPPVYLAHELEAGRSYYVLLSGGNGLYRYDINDVVEVQGFHGRTPRIAFVRKGRDMVNITGEKLHLNHLQAAIAEAEDETKLPVWQFRFIPDVDGWRYDLLVEFQGARIETGAGRAFLVAVDRALARLNREYAGKRASRRLRPPTLHVMRPGWAEGQCRADFRAGKRDAQHKWPAIRLEWDAASRAEVLERVDDGGSADA